MNLPDLPIDTLYTIDFETYWAVDFTLSGMTTASYVRDPRFQVIGVGVKEGSAPARWMAEPQFLAWVQSVNWSRAAVLAHNCEFDGFILAERYGVKPAFWLDTLSMARPLHGTEVGGSLGKLATHYDLGEKGDDTKWSKGLRLEHFSAEQWAAYGRYCVNDCELTYKLFQKLSPGFPEDELWLIDTTIRMFTEPGFKANQSLLKRFHAEEQQRKLDLLARISADKDTLMSNDKFATLLTELGADVPTKISAPKSKTASTKAGFPVEVETWALAKSDPGFQELLKHPEDEIRWLAEARLGVKSTINETRAERFMKAGENDRYVPVQLNYYGAHTGRWSGGGKQNFQNLMRTDRNKDGSLETMPDGYPVAGHLRCALVAPPGMSIIACDSGQIEVRVEGWLAGHDELMETFCRNDLKTAEYKRTGQGEKGDVYSDFGSTLFGTKISEATHPTERFVSKFSLLGCGYGLGGFKFGQGVLQGKKPVQFKEDAARKFGVNVPEWAADRPYRSAPTNAERTEETPSRLPYAERLTHFAVSHHFVKLYREQNPPIVALWGDLKAALEQMLEDYPNGVNGPKFGPGGCLHVVRHGIVLPNGLKLRYPGLARSGSGFSYMGGHRGKQRVKAYGGSMAENITQALARIIVAEQMLRIRFAVAPLGGRLLMMSHDEVVVLAPKLVAEQVAALAVSEMRIPPDWCADIPLNASVGIGQSYGHAK